MSKHILLYMMVVFFATHARCQQWYETGNPHFLDTSSVFSAIKQANTIKVIKFFSPWCKYCRFIKAFIDNFKSSHEVSSNLKFYEFNCQSNGAEFCFKHFQVRAYPAVIIINQHGDSIQRIDGLYPQDVLDSLLEDFNNRAKALLTQHQENKLDEQNKKQAKQEEQPAQKKQEAKQQQEKTHQEVKRIEVKPQQGQIHNKQRHQVQQKKEQQIVKKMVDQLGAQDTEKAHPSKPDQEEEMFKYQVKQQSSSTLKYILYLVGITIGILYAIKIFTNHKEEEKQPKANPPQKQAKNSQAKPNSKISSRDIQNQILVQEISDQHL